MRGNDLISRVDKLNFQAYRSNLIFFNNIKASRDKGIFVSACNRQYFLSNEKVSIESIEKT